MENYTPRWSKLIWAYTPQLGNTGLNYDEQQQLKASMIYERIWRFQKTFMARKITDNPNEFTTPTFFVQCSLNANERNDFQRWLDEEGARNEMWIEDLTALGYKISLSYVSTRAAYCVSLTNKDPKSINVGGIVTSWSSDWREALLLGAYKISVVLPTSSWKELHDKAAWG